MPVGPELHPDHFTNREMPAGWTQHLGQPKASAPWPCSHAPHYSLLQGHPLSPASLASNKHLFSLGLFIPPVQVSFTGADSSLEGNFARSDS